MPLARSENQNGFSRGQGDFRETPFQRFFRIVGQAIAGEDGRCIRPIDHLDIIGIGAVGVRQGNGILSHDFVKNQGIGCPDPGSAVSGIAFLGIGISRRAVRGLAIPGTGPNRRDVCLQRDGDGRILYFARGVLECEGLAARRFQPEGRVQRFFAVSVAENDQVFVRRQGIGRQQPGRVAVGQRPAVQGHTGAGGVVKFHPVVEKTVFIWIGGAVAGHVFGDFHTRRINTASRLNRGAGRENRAQNKQQNKTGKRTGDQSQTAAGGGEGRHEGILLCT